MTLIYVLAAVIAASVSFYLTGLARRFALRNQILTLPRQRDVHSKATPRLGGGAIALGILISLLLISLFDPELLKLTNQVRFQVDRHLLGIVLGIVLLTITGVWDDVRDLSAGKQLFWQFIAAAVIVASGIGINFIRSPWGILPLDQWTWRLFAFGDYTYTITLWSDLFTIAWLIIMMNVINWLDGLDGLAAGVSSIASLMLFILALMIHDTIGVAIIAIAIFGSLVGFLPWNWHPAKIFMGSAGSHLLGFLLGVLAIVSGGKLATSLLVLGLPFFDAVFVAIRRILKGKSPFHADRSHLHHRLIDSGLGVPKSVLVMYLVALIFGVLALVDSNARAKFVLLIWTVAVLVLITVTTLVLEKRNRKKIQ